MNYHRFANFALVISLLAGCNSVPRLRLELPEDSHRTAQRAERPRHPERGSESTSAKYVDSATASTEVAAESDRQIEVAKLRDSIAKEDLPRLQKQLLQNQLSALLQSDIDGSPTPTSSVRESSRSTEGSALPPASKPPMASGEPVALPEATNTVRSEVSLPSTGTPTVDEKTVEQIARTVRQQLQIEEAKKLLMNQPEIGNVTALLDVDDGGGITSAVAELPFSTAAMIQAAGLNAELGAASTATASMGSMETTDANIGSAETEATESEPIDWEESITQTIVGLEQLALDEPDKETKARIHAMLRLLYLIDDRRDAALQPIEDLREDERDYFKHLTYGLMVWLDAEQRHAPSRRAALALRDLRVATNHLANLSTLDVRNLAFCKQVTSYGNYTEFPTYVFRPNEELLLYVEVENFASERFGEQFETELLGEYSIFDENGNRITNVVLPLDKQLCNNRRRDYFIAYRVFLPANIPDGTHTLVLTMEDVKGKKSNQASIEFRVR